MVLLSSKPVTISDKEDEVYSKLFVIIAILAIIIKGEFKEQGERGIMGATCKHTGHLQQWTVASKCGYKQVMHVKKR